MRWGVAAFVFCLLVAGVVTTRPAGAVKPFLEQFKALYVKPQTTDRTMKIFNLAVEKKSCTICHVLKTPHGAPFNAYGAQLAKLLNAKRDMQNPAAIRAAMAKVARKKAKPDDPHSPTFGARLKDGKLPVGEIHVRPKKPSEETDNPM